MGGNQQVERSGIAGYKVLIAPFVTELPKRRQSQYAVEAEFAHNISKKIYKSRQFIRNYDAAEWGHIRVLAVAGMPS